MTGTPDFSVEKLAFMKYQFHISLPSLRSDIDSEVRQIIEYNIHE